MAPSKKLKAFEQNIYIFIVSSCYCFSEVQKKATPLPAALDRKNFMVDTVLPQKIPFYVNDTTIINYNQSEI